jgi:hypothetical protein
MAFDMAFDMALEAVIMRSKGELGRSEDEDEASINISAPWAPLTLRRSHATEQKFLPKVEHLILECPAAANMDGRGITSGACSAVND